MYEVFSFFIALSRLSFKYQQVDFIPLSEIVITIKSTYKSGWKLT